MKLPETITYESDGHIALVTLNRPEARNALTPEMMAGLEEAFAEFQRDDDLWVAILTGAGDESFCAGGDLAQTIPMITAGGFSGFFSDATKRFFSEVFKPIIAQVNGYCIAGGLEILLGTDIRVCADHVMFGAAEVKWGLVPVGGTHIRLPRQIPWAIAMEMLLTGQNIPAQRAYQVGLVNRVVPQAELASEARRMAERLCQNGPIALRTAKEIAVRGLQLETPFTLEASLSQRAFLSEDAQEGPRAFFEKRRPHFNGR